MYTSNNTMVRARTTKQKNELQHKQQQINNKEEDSAALNSEVLNCDVKNILICETMSIMK